MNIFGSGTNFFGATGSALSLLDAGRLQSNGIGLSNTARYGIKQFLSQSRAGNSALFSSSLEIQSSVEGMQKKILALRAQAPQGRLSRAVRELIEEEASPSSPTRGSKVDTSA